MRVVSLKNIHRATHRLHHDTLGIVGTEAELYALTRCKTNNIAAKVIAVTKHSKKVFSKRFFSPDVSYLLHIGGRQNTPF